MAFDEVLARRIEQMLDDRDGVAQRKMFGGIAYMLHGNMAVGIVKDELMLRLGDAGVAEALKQPHTRPMDFTGKIIKSMVYVEPAGFKSDKQLRSWVDRALAFAATLPRK
jgi:TfoX/Sxy family transcriptional regulator of competence genes